MKTISSKKISYITGTSKHSINCLISNYSKQLTQFGELKEVKIVENKKGMGGRPTIDYELNENQTILIISLMKNNPKIVEILTEYVKSKNIFKVIEETEKIKDEDCSGYLYIIQKKNKLVKIGISKNPEKRINAIETHNGEQSVKKFVSKKLLNYMEVEKKMHNYFKDFRVRGEWFNVDFDLAVEIFASVMPKTQVPMIEKI